MCSKGGVKGFVLLLGLDFPSNDILLDLPRSALTSIEMSESNLWKGARPTLPVSRVPICISPVKVPSTIDWTVDTALTSKGFDVAIIYNSPFSTDQNATIVDIVVNE